MRKISNLKSKLVATLAVIVFVLFAYLADIKCMFLSITSIPCPCCGLTRAYLSLLRLDFAAAFGYHMMFWSVPIIYLYILYDGRLFKNKKADIFIWILFGIGFAVNWIANIFELGIF